MNRTTILLAVLLSVVAGVFAYRGWTPVDIKDIPRAEPTDEIVLIQLEAPLFFDKYGRLLEKFHLFHSGLGLMNMRTGVNWTVEFDALPSFFTAVAPIINKTADGTVTLEWHNNGGAMLYLSINETYWISHQTVVGKINGSVHNNFLEWLKPINTTHPHYNLFAVYDHWNEDETKRNMFMSSYTCFDLLFEMYDALYALGARFDVAQTRRNFMNFYAKSAPVRVDFDDPNHHKKILHFYETLEGKSKMMNFAELILEILTIFKGEAYLRKDEDYYHVQLHFPSLNWKYSYVQLPGHKKTTSTNFIPKKINIVKN